jgi:HEAT repeat protein
MKKQMHIFVHTAEGDLRATAGRTLALTKCGDENSFDPLVQILDDKNIKIKYRMIAAEILENMCAQCDKQRVKDILLPKVSAQVCLANSNISG